VHNVVLVEVVDCLEDLSNRLGRVLFGEFALFADAIEQLSAGRQLCDDVIFVLGAVSASMQQSLLEMRVPLTRTSRGT
jgi:hypothetical protein